MSEKKLYTITEEQAEIIREALSTCDGDWWIAVRWGEDWNPRRQGFGILLGSNGVYAEEGFEGVEIALCFSPETTILGTVHKVLECSEIRGVRIEGKYRNEAKITDLTSLQDCTLLKKLTLNGCSSLVDISPIASLKNVHTLALNSCSLLVDISPLSSLQNIHTLSLSFNESLIDISPLSSLHNIQTLALSWCDSLMNVLPLASLKNIQTLNLGHCKSLVDISPLSSIQNLKTLNLGHCKSLVDISPLSSLQNIQTLSLSFHESLVDTSPLSSLQNIQTLNLGGCSSLVDISPLSSIQNLKTLDLSWCNELADNRTWTPLTKLPSLKELQGSFPSYFTTKIFARNAANDRDWEYIAKNLAEWIQTAESSSTEPNLLAQVGRACAVHPDGYESLTTIISLSTTNDAPEIDELFATSAPLASHDIIGVAIQSAVDQSKQLLPPETLVALHNHLPNNTTLRDNTIVALTRSISQDSVPEWGEKTAKALREELNDSRYPITTSVHDEGLSVLANQQFTPIQSHFFGVLCSGHARSTDIEWRNHFHNLLCGLALSQSDTSTRNQALSDISSGLAICSDSEWVQQRLDYLLKAAAEIDPDTSVIYAAVAHAHAIGGRWDEAQKTVSGIASPTVRDVSLNKLCAMVLESNLPDKMQRAISFVNALSEPMERAQKLYELGFHDGLLADLVAYGQLVGLLTEFPEKQKEVVAHITEKKPEMVEKTSENPISNLSDEECYNMLQRAVQQMYPHTFAQLLDRIIPERRKQ